MLFLKASGSADEYRAGIIDRAIAKGWLMLHESDTYVRFYRGLSGAVRMIG